MNRTNEEVNKLNIKIAGVNDFDLLGQAYAAVFDSSRNCLWTLNKDLLKIDLENQQVEVQTAISFDIDAPNKNPLAILPNGQLLVGRTLSQLALFDPDKGEVDYLLENKTANYEDITTIVFKVQGNDSLWVGTQDNGLYLFEKSGKLLQHFHTASQPPLSSNHIICLHLDKDNNVLWTGTFGGGINGIQLSTGEVMVFSQKDGLSNNNVVSILDDEAGQNH